MSQDKLSPISVVISRSKTISENIPDDVTRAKAARWLEIISPVTEWCGLVGDRLNHKRQLFRLEREAALYEVAERLKEKLDGKRVTPIPAKQLIPALEKASLEEPGSEFIETWARLLASAAIDPGDDILSCASILAELGHEEAKLLHLIQERLVAASLWPNDISRRASNMQSFVEKNYREARNVMFNGQIANSSINEASRLHLRELFSRSPLLVVRLVLITDGGRRISTGTEFSERSQVAIDVLEYRNLIKRRSYEPLDIESPAALSVHWFDLTALGVRFLKRVSAQS